MELKGQFPLQLLIIDGPGFGITEGRREGPRWTGYQHDVHFDIRVAVMAGQSVSRDTVGVQRIGRHISNHTSGRDLEERKLRCFTREKVFGRKSG